jgi:IclR family transcriptional regulator, acetate operon repressor
MDRPDLADMDDPESASKTLTASLGRGPGRGVLDGAFRLLRALPQINGPGQLSDLARATGIPRPSVHRLLTQLSSVGAVERQHGQYVLGTAMLEIARRVEPTAGLRRGAAEVMRALREQTGVTVSLLTQAGEGAVVLDMIPGRESLPVDIYAGYVMPPVAAGALVLDPSAAPERVRPAERAAMDDEHTVPGLTCYATAITLQGGGAAALQLTSTNGHNAIQLAALAHQGAARITDRIRRTASQSC